MIYHLNNSSAESELGGLKEFRQYVMNNGIVYYNFPSIIKSLCTVDVTYFPFDVQICRFKFGSWMHHGMELNLSLSAESGSFLSPSVCLSASLSLHLHGYAYFLFCLSVCLSLCLSVCLSVLIMIATNIQCLSFTSREIITKTCLCNFDPLKPHFYIEKNGVAGVYIIFSYFCYKT